MMLIFIICPVSLDEELVVVYIIWCFYLWQCLQLTCRFQFSSLNVWLDKELLVLPIFMYFYLRQLLQFSWRFWFSSLALSDLMKSQCFSWSWSDFTLDSLFNFLEDFNCHHLPCLTWWGIDGSTNLLMFLPLIAPSILLKGLIFITCHHCLNEKLLVLSD